MFHVSIKSASKFGLILATDPSSRSFPLLQLSIQKTIDQPTTSSVKTQTLEEMNADERRHTLNNFDATLVEGFAGGNGMHPKLNAELSKLGAHHEAKTLLLKTDDRIWGMAYRLRSYYALNATGVMNSLFLIVLPDTRGEDVIAGLRTLVENGLAFGTDDLALIVSGKFGADYKIFADFPDAKPYTFFIIDNLLNREFLGHNIDIESPQTKRKKRSE